MRADFARRLLAELAIIFVGVVLAFQFENWRERGRDREREAETLQALAEDFATNRRILGSTLRAQERTVEAMDLWVRAAAGEPVDASLDSLGYVFPWAISWYAEEIVSGAFDALIGSGDIGLLQDASLRRRLADFYGVVDSGFEDHDDEMNTLALIVDRTRVQLGPLLAPGGARPSRDSVPDLDHAVVRELVAIPGLWGLLAWKSVLARNRLTRLAWLAGQADTIALILPSPAGPATNGR